MLQTTHPYQRWLCSGYVSRDWFLTLDFLQAMSKVEKSWIGSTFLVVCKNQTTIVVHALPNKAAMLEPQLITLNKEISG